MFRNGKWHFKAAGKAHGEALARRECRRGFLLARDASSAFAAASSENAGGEVDAG